MLAPSGGGLILYQAYGNLYAMTGRKAHLLEDKQIPSVGVFDEVFSTWMAFGGNTRDLGSFGEGTENIMDLHQIHEEVLLTERGDGRNKTNTNDLESDDESVDTPLVSPFPHSDNDSDDSEVLNDLIEYENVGMLRREKVINSFDGDDLKFQCMIGFRKLVAYFDPFLPMNILTHKAYNTIMVEGLKSTGKNLVSIVRDVYVFVGSFTYITGFVVLEDIGEFIQINKVEVVMGKPFRKITKLEYDYAYLSIGSLIITHSKCHAPYLGLNVGDIFDDKKLGSSFEVSLDDSWRTI
ncbi:hypothetical protein Tco_0370368 [Tanacetum coccineum]